MPAAATTTPIHKSSRASSGNAFTALMKPSTPWWPEPGRIFTTLPLLTVISDAIGLAGGALLCRYLLDMPLTQYLERVNDSIAPTTFWVGIVKAPFFAVLIALAGVYRGMQVRDSSRELGRLTTVAVVQSIFLVILADALFAVLSLELGL